MTSAQFPAALVHERAIARIDAMNAKIEAKTAEAINAAMANPVETGMLWWKSTRYRTREEAEAWIGHSNGFRGSIKYWSTWTERHTINDLQPLKRIAAAAIAAGTTTVTLTPADCAVLDIPMKEAA